MSEISKTARAMMAADLCGRAAKTFREGRSLRGVQLAINVDMIHRGADRAEAVYFVALRGDGLTPADIDAAVASILRGEHPADSLAGRILKMRDDAGAPEYVAPTRADGLLFGYVVEEVKP